MANIKISQLTPASSVNGTDLFEISQGAASRRATLNQISSFASSSAGISGLTSGRVIFAASSTSISNDSNFFWDNSNKRLGIGPTSPDQRLHLSNSGANNVLAKFSNSATSGGAFAVGINTAGEGVVSHSNAKSILFECNATEVLKLNTGGAIQIISTPGTDASLTHILVRDQSDGAIKKRLSTDFQPSDAELTAIAGLTSAADRLPYFTGLGTASLATFTSFARTFIDDANASDALSTLGVSAFIKTLLDDADASTARGTLGLGTIAIQNSNNVTITGGSVTGITDITIADGGTGASTASAARDNLGVQIGVNVQAYDAELAAIASTTSAANALPYFTGSGTATTTTLSSFARTLIDDADAETARATLGISATGTGTIYTPTVTGVSNVASVSVAVCHYIHVGDIVVVGGDVTIDPTSAAVETIIRISLPISVASLASVNGANGTCVSKTSFSPGFIEGDPINLEAELHFIPSTSSSQHVSFIFEYLTL